MQIKYQHQNTTGHHKIYIYRTPQEKIGHHKIYIGHHKNIYRTQQIYIGHHKIYIERHKNISDVASKGSPPLQLVLSLISSLSLSHWLFAHVRAFSVATGGCVHMCGMCVCVCVCVCVCMCVYVCVCVCVECDPLFRIFLFFKTHTKHEFLNPYLLLQLSLGILGNQ